MEEPISIPGSEVLYLGTTYDGWPSIVLGFVHGSRIWVGVRSLRKMLTWDSGYGDVALCGGTLHVVYAGPDCLIYEFSANPKEQGGME